MSTGEPSLNLIIGVAIGLFGGVGLAYLVIWSARRQARLVQQHIDKYQLKLGDSPSLFLISNQLTIIFDQSELIVSDIKKDAPRRIKYSDIELVVTEWQKRRDMHKLTIKPKGGEAEDYNVMQVYHFNFQEKQAKSKKNSIIITQVVRERLERSGVAVTVSS